MRRRYTYCFAMLTGILAAFAGNAGHVPAYAFLKNGVTAHRGFSAKYPENTMPAFQAALELGVDWIECDLFTTKDGQLVVIHDATTGRVGDLDLRVKESTYEELLVVDVAHAFRERNNLSDAECPIARIPLLAEVLELIKSQNRTRLSIQPKDESTQAALTLLAKLEAERWAGFNDGDFQKMAAVKQFNKQIPVFWDRGPNADLVRDLQMAKPFGFESFVIHESGLTAEKIAMLHEAGVEAGAWTVNSPQRMKQLLEMGIDRIYTDSPDELLRLTNLESIRLPD